MELTGTTCFTYPNSILQLLISANNHAIIFLIREQQMSNAPDGNDPLNVNPTTEANTANPYVTPQVQQVTYMPPQHGQDMQGDATGGLIPYKNKHALIAYYLGIFSFFIPFSGIASICLGIKGLQARKRNPVIKGSAHAIVGIVAGVCTIIFHICAIVGIVVGNLPW